jgi:hypothetical protein
MKYFLIIIISLSNFLVSGQNDTIPLNLTIKYFKGELRSYKSVLTGEAKGQNINPRNISTNANFEFETLDYSDDMAVIAVSITEENQHTDLYTFWNKDKDWKISAFRSLWLPGLFYILLDNYKDLDDEGIKLEYKKMFEEAKQKNDSLTDELITKKIGTLEDLYFEIENMKLTVSSDKGLLEHFYKNQDKFKAIIEKIQNDSIYKKNAYKNQNMYKFSCDSKELLISSITAYDNNSQIDFLIGGMIDNRVGYLYCKNPEDVPEISENRYIMIRKIGNGWYLYKTT